MKKILTREAVQRKSRRNQLIVGIVLVLLMLISTIGYSFMDSSSDSSISSKITYNGIVFQKNSELWSFVINNNEFATYFNPEETKDIQISITKRLEDFKTKPLYLVGDPSDGFSEISRNMIDRFVLRMQPACLNEKECKDNLPIKNCLTDNIIVIKEPVNNESSRIYQTNNCIYIVADSINQTRFADATLFKFLGI